LHDDPLVHIVRNAIDHGIEVPAMRRAAGKPETGRLEVSARQSGNQILIEIADDGRGYMKAELTGDGVHLTAATYHLLSDYIMEHGIVDRNHPAHPAKSSESQS
jgi:LytS/YehU family sensor histidine kinase